MSTRFHKYDQRWFGYFEIGSLLVALMWFVLTTLHDCARVLTTGR